MGLRRLFFETWSSDCFATCEGLCGILFTILELDDVIGNRYQEHLEIVWLGVRRVPNSCVFNIRMYWIVRYHLRLCVVLFLYGFSSVAVFVLRFSRTA